jgi:hypothetical protein
MPLAVTLILTLLILLITSLGIGSAVLILLGKKLKLHPAQSLCLAIALSWLIVFQLAFAAFAAGHFQVAPIPILLLFLLSLLSLAIAHKQLLRWLKYPFTRSMLAAFSLLLAWHLLNHAGIITYSWGFWYGDWHEHYQRMLFFTLHQPLSTTFLDGLYTLPARPPMQNVCQAYIASLTTNAFSGFQLSSTFLATLLALPVFLLTRHMAQGRRPRVSLWVAAALLAASWPFLVASTFTWTKAFAGFYALLAIALYLRPPSRSRDILVFLVMGAGLTVHYSVALILIPLLLWHAATFLKTPKKLPAALASGIPGILVLLPWLLFIKLAFSGSLLGSTTTAQLTSKLTFSQAVLWAIHNTIATLLPAYPPRIQSSILSGLTDPNPAVLRSTLFTLVNHTWALSIGLTGLLILAIESSRRLNAKSLLPQQRFWLWMIPASALAIAIAQPLQPDYGSAHIALLPLIVMTAAWIAGAWSTLSKFTRIAFLALASLQMLLILFDASFFTSTPRLPDGATFPGFDPSRTFDIPTSAIGNLGLRYANQLTFLADPLAPHLQTLFYAISLFALAWLLILARQVRLPKPSRAG